MNPLNLNDVNNFIELHIDEFHQRRADNLLSLKLITVIERKNPYSIKAKNIVTAQDFVKLLVDAHLSSQEEAIFGALLEKLAIFICSITFNGRKSAAEGIDLEFERDGIMNIVSIKPGPRWGNSSQIKRMIENFIKAKRILRSSNSQQNIRSINGCCYGKNVKIDKGEYYKICGQDFWEYISGSSHLFIDIIEPLGFQAQQRNEKFSLEYVKLLNQFTNQFFQEYCLDGLINWELIVNINSQSMKKGLTLFN